MKTANHDRSSQTVLPFVAAAVIFAVAFAGVLASANLAGYLVGALMAMHPLARFHSITLVRVGSIIVVFGTALMALSPSAWFAARCATGVAGGLVYVLTTSIVFDLVAKIDSKHGVAITFSGVGMGMVVATLLVLPFTQLGGSRAAWFGISAVSAIALAFALPLLPTPGEAPPAKDVAAVDRNAAMFGWLAVLYGVEGAAYIIPATFLVAMVSETPSIAHYAAGDMDTRRIVTAPSTIWWSAIARPFVATRVALVTGSYRFALLIAARALGLVTAAFALRLTKSSAVSH